MFLVGGDGVELSHTYDDNTPEGILVNIKGDANFTRLNCEEVFDEINLTRLHSITPAYVDTDGNIDIGSPVSAGALGNIVFLASDYHDGVVDDAYDSLKPTLRIYREGNTLMFEIAGLNKTVS